MTIDLVEWEELQREQNLVPIKNLWADVLMLSVRDAICDPRDSKILADRKEGALKWLLSDEDAGTPCSVTWVCDQLGIKFTSRIRDLVTSGDRRTFDIIRAKVFKGRGRGKGKSQGVTDVVS